MGEHQENPKVNIFRSFENIGTDPKICKILKIFQKIWDIMSAIQYLTLIFAPCFENNVHVHIRD